GGVLHQAVRARRPRGRARRCARLLGGRLAPSRRGNRPLQVVLLNMFSPRRSRDRGVLVVPVLPGTALRAVEAATPGEPESRRVLLVAAAVAGALALIAAAAFLFSRGSAKTPAASAPAPTPP